MTSIHPSNLFRIVNSPAGRRLVLMAIATAGSLTSVAQSNFKKGYLVTMGGDTLRGFIDHKEWSKSPKAFAFKESLQDEAFIEYSPTRALYFEVEGESFLHYHGPISMDKNTDRASDVLTLQSVNDTVFLKTIAMGKFVNLYSYRDKMKNRFFISQRTGVPEELIYRVYPDDGGEANRVVVDDRYKSQLRTVANDHGALNEKVAWMINKASYGNKSIGDIVDKINGDTKIVNASAKKSGVHLYVGAGLNRAQLHFKEYYGWTTSSATSYQPYMALGIDLLGNQDVGKLVIRGELSAGLADLRLRADSATVTGGLKSIDYSSSQFTMTLLTQIQYNFYNTSKWKVFAGAGIRFNVSSYSNHNFDITSDNSNVVVPVETGFEFVPVWLSYNLQAGVIFNQRFEFTIAYIPQVGSFTSYHNLLGQSISYTRTGLNYHFGLRK